MKNPRFFPWLSFLLLGLPIILLLPGISGFPFPPGSAYSDLAITHFPNAIFLRRSLLENHQIPLWSSTILSGYPFFANPLSGLWYPPGWLALLLPLPLGLNLSAALHLLLGGIGMYRLLRVQGLSHPAALFGALAFEALPKSFAHYGAGHLTLLYAVSWTPWLLQTARHTTSIRDARPAVFLALIFLADPRWTVFAGAAWLLFTFLQRGSGLPLLPVAGRMAVQASLAALLSAPLLLPLAQYTALSTRASLASADVLLYSLEPARLLGLVYPAFGGFYENTLYVGEVGLLLSCLALLWGATRRQAAPWAWLAGLSLLYALGAYLPGMDWLARLPLLDLLRVPSRALFLTGLSMAALAAYALDKLLAAGLAVLSSGDRRRGALFLAVIAVFSLALALGIWTLTGKLSITFAWGAASCSLSAAWISLRMAAKVPGRAWLIGVFILILVDVGAMDSSLFEMRPAVEVLGQARDAAHFLANQAGPMRIYSPSYSLPQQTAAAERLELADGVDPLQLQAYVTYMGSATGVPTSGYNVTLPPYVNGDPQIANAAARPQPGALGLLNVRYIASEFDLQVEGLKLRARFGNTRVYENLLAQPRAWVQVNDHAAGEQGQPASLQAWTPDQLELQAQGPGLLVLAELAYPGWRVWVDGKPANLLVEDGLLRAVRLSAGEHRIVFRFLPLSLWAGLGLFILGVLLCCVLTHLKTAPFQAK